MVLPSLVFLKADASPTRKQRTYQMVPSKHDIQQLITLILGALKYY